MSSDPLVLDLLVIAYGYNDKRVEISLKPKIPVGLEKDLPRLNEWTHAFIFKLGKDAKHNERWDCEICGKPARETNFNVMSWIHLPQPKLNVYINHVCDASYRSACYLMLKSQREAMSLLVGQFPQTFPDDRTAQAATYPLSASCARCHGEDTGSPHSKISRCAGCKLTRYCSVDCQTNDWNRHKKICKTVKDVKWFNWD